MNITADTTFTARETMTSARRLQQHMAEQGHEVTLADAWAMTRIAQIAARRTILDLEREAREDRVRKGMVANWCDDMRAVGAWDGE